MNSPTQQATSLHHEAAQAAWDFLRRWEGPTSGATGDWQALHDFGAAMQQTAGLDWLVLCGEELDDERLRLRNRVEANAEHERERILIARNCEDLADSLEADVAATMARLPEALRTVHLADHLYSCFHNIIGLRLLIGIETDRLSERLYGCYTAGVLPVGWEGTFPDGRPIVYLPEGD